MDDQDQQDKATDEAVSEQDKVINTGQPPEGEEKDEKNESLSTTVEDS